ncbi:MAG TPA: MBL fold metallo-hydrolase [Acidobacteriota bacterium]|nr:MBL fold metallo-hydrolase [Acidobacteriota bacterium]
MRGPAVLLLLGLVLLATPAMAQDEEDFSAVEIRTTRLTDSIYMLEGSGGNIGVCIGEDGTFIVDDQFAPLTDKITAAIARLTDQPVEFVINTHWHYDHTDGNENFGEAGALIVSHENSRRRMETDQFLELFARPQPAYSAVGLPKITFSRSMSFYLNGESIDVFHRGAAHTDGDAVIYFRTSNVVHSGDVFVRYGFPYIDQPNGGSIQGMIRTVGYLASITDDDTTFIPGHGQLSTRDDLLAYGAMLRTIRDRVQAQINQGRSLDEVIASNPTAGYEQRGTGAAEFAKIVYDSLRASE